MGLQAAFEQTLHHAEPLLLLENMIWQSLSAASQAARHPWHAGAFSTVTQSPPGPLVVNSRTVILRAVDPEFRTLDCHTDARSQKVADLNDHDSASWLFYDARSKIQLRLNGSATVINDQQTDQAWKATRLHSRSAYLSIHSPGQLCADQQPPDTDDRCGTMEQSERGRDHFRIVRFQALEMDWLYLRREGHLRARTRYAEPLAQQAKWRWVIP